MFQNSGLKGFPYCSLVPRLYTVRVLPMLFVAHVKEIVGQYIELGNKAKYLAVRRIETTCFAKGKNMWHRILVTVFRTHRGSLRYSSPPKRMTYSLGGYNIKGCMKIIT